MKYVPIILVGFITLLLIGASIWLMVQKVEGWGWFAFFSFLGLLSTIELAEKALK